MSRVFVLGTLGGLLEHGEVADPPFAEIPNVRFREVARLALATLMGTSSWVRCGRRLKRTGVAGRA